MDLKEFVAETIVEITEGIKEAQQRCVPLGAQVNPGGLSKRVTDQQIFWDENGTFAERIKFDVAVTASTETSAKGKAGISVWAVDAGGEGSRTSTNSTVSRIRFGVLMVLSCTVAKKKSAALVGTG